MKKPLIKQLNEYIQFHGEVYHNDIKQKCETGYWGRYYKISNAERRLRPSDSPHVFPVMEGNHVKKYIWTGPRIEKKYNYVTERGVVEVTESKLPKFLLQYPLARKLTIN
jgi:hypothetical protein